MEARRLCLHKGTHEGLEKSGREVEEKWRQKRRAITCFSIAYADFVEDVGKNKTIGGMRAHARGAADGGREKEASGKKRGRLFPKNNKKTGKAGIKWEKWYVGKWKEGVPHAKGQKKQHRTARGRDAVEGEGVVGHQCTTISSTKRKPGLPLAAWCQSGMECSGVARTLR